jgi:UDP-glucose 4-epimerase
MLRCLAGLPMIVFGDGTQTRDFTFVEDTARAILLAGASPAAVGQTINVGAGREVTVRDLAGVIAEVTGRPGAAVTYDAPRPGDVLRLCADSARARGLLGYEPRVSLREGLARLLDWYRASGAPAARLLEQERPRNWEFQERKCA